MARLEGLLIHGIRSFGADRDDTQIIRFNAPLTLILGRNGCGKTTIIEALKYATIGELPFGQGAAFIHDPKVARELEVKGQIKLEFRSTDQKTLTVTRNLVGTQKVKKLEVVSIDNTIQVKDPVTKEPKTVSSRCVDINDLMIDNLGVSKPIISNVIFCHQEDASWPLEESKKLKERFDAIFDSTKHNKCLDEIRRVRKEVLDELKKCKTELTHLKDKRDFARSKRLQLEDERKRYDELMEKIQGMKDVIQSKEKEYRELSSTHNNYAHLQSNRERKKALYESLLEQQAQLLACIKTEFVGSKDDLITAISEFEIKMRERVENRERFETQIGRYKSLTEEKMREINLAMAKRGEMVTESRVLDERILERNQKLQSLLKDCGLSDTGDLQTDYDFRLCMSEAQEHLIELDHKLGFTQSTHDEEEKRLQSNVDAKRIAISKLEQEIVSKENSIKATNIDIRDKREKLKEVNSSVNRLRAIEAEIATLNGKLETLRKSVDIESLQEQINSKAENCKRLEEKQCAVNEEVKTLLMHSNNQSKLAELDKQKSSLNNTLRKLRNKHEEGLKRLLNDSREGFMNYDLQNRLRTLEQNIKKDNQKIITYQQEINNLTLQRKHKREQLTAFEDEVKVATEKIYQLCGNKTLEAVIQEEEKKLQGLQDETGMLASSEFMYNKYIQKLNEQEPCCPLCQRNFEAEHEALILVQELKSKIGSLPTRLQENKEQIQEIKGKLNKLVELRSTNERVSELKTRIIPSQQSALEVLEMDLDSKNQDIAVLSASIIVPQEDEALARSMLSDVGVMDQLSNDLKKVVVESEKIAKLLPPGGLQRTAEEAQAENEYFQTELSETRGARDSLQTQLQNYRAQLNDLEQKLNQKVTEQLRIKGIIQERVQIEERLAELQKVLSSTENERDDVRRRLVPAKDDLAEAETSLQNARTAHRKEFEIESRDVSKIKTRFEEIRTIHKDVQNRQSKRYAEKLDDLVVDIERLTKHLEDYQNSVKDNEAKLKVVAQEIAESKTEERTLQDNLELRNKRERAAELKKEVNAVTAQLGSLNIAEVEAQLGELETNLAGLKAQRSKAEGTAMELDANIQERRRELDKEIFRLAERKYKEKYIEMSVHERTETDLQKLYIGYDYSLMKFHRERMATINSIIKELWMKIYRGNDIDYIEIRTDDPKLTVSTSAAEKRRIYNYRVVQIKNETELDMRGRCSAGQKVLASLIIRMALAETFSLNCNILSLDEPTTNLDGANIASLSEAILEIVQNRMVSESFQLIVITHDVDFMKMLLSPDFISHYYEVFRNHEGKSVIKKRKCDELLDN